MRKIRGRPTRAGCCRLNKRNICGGKLRSTMNPERLREKKISDARDSDDFISVPSAFHFIKAELRP